MIRMLSRFRRDDRGATALEYGLIAALVFVVSVAGWQALGGNAEGLIVRTMTTIGEALS
ncbi:MAG: Flp family type IVb pilin [Brevundimonas sp.]|uniref:Flp family type IVb pilin n=1 Tax=Brevundimonas sp. TaxID=1871086 RepID=UPI0022CB835D|nr:Flp family type IVb pilin [Brevundimonas sp.]MCZ8193973.1 Flp family type IVb pilin [Brevundimonas sp.]